MPLSIEAGNEWYSADEYSSKWRFQSKIVEANIVGQPVEELPIFGGLRISVADMDGYAYGPNGITTLITGFDIGLGGTAAFKFNIGDWRLFGRGSFSMLFARQSLHLTTEGLKAQPICPMEPGGSMVCESNRSLGLMMANKIGFEVGGGWKGLIGSLGCFNLLLNKNQFILGPSNYFGLRFMLGVEF